MLSDRESHNEPHLSCANIVDERRRINPVMESVCLNETFINSRVPLMVSILFGYCSALVRYNFPSQ